MRHTDKKKQFNKSFEQCVNNPFFLDKFYELFLSSSDEVSLLFSNTNMDIQKAMLATSMVYMTKTHDKHFSELSKVANRHSKSNLDIKPHLYPLWLNSLIAAAHSIDPLFDQRTEKLWRQVMQPGIDYMMGKYNKTSS